MGIDLNIQTASTCSNIPDEAFIKKIAGLALEDITDAEITIRVVDKDESRNLNSKWRGIPKPTNVLSFPISSGDDVVPVLMGDIVICAPVVEEEISDQAKSADAHWAHMIVHGILHLLGYDHIEDNEAKIMESQEIRILRDCGYTNPYLET